MVAATTGLVAGSADAVRTIPAIAPAALARIGIETEFRPAISTTEYIIVISLVPKYWRVSPAATVDTMTLGKPIGSARMTAVTRVVPPVPPSPRIPWIAP